MPLPPNILPFSRVTRPASPGGTSCPEANLPKASDYRFYPMPAGPDYVISRALIDLILLHLVGEATDEQRRVLAQEMTTMAGIEL